MKEKGELVARMKRRIISTLLAGMSAHRDEETMMRNGCLALCQFRIPQDVVRVIFNLLNFYIRCSSSITFDRINSLQLNRAGYRTEKKTFIYRDM